MSDQEYVKYLSRAMKWCSQAERCRADVQEKLIKWGTPKIYYSRILYDLEQENFIDEARYASAFVNDKFKFNQWGRIKITHALRSRSIPEAAIYEALGRIDEEEYRELAYHLMQKKNEELDEEYNVRKQKLFRFMASRGFETGIIFDLWERL